MWDLAKLVAPYFANNVFMLIVITVMAWGARKIINNHLHEMANDAFLAVKKAIQPDLDELKYKLNGLGTSLDKERNERQQADIEQGKDMVEIQTNITNLTKLVDRIDRKVFNGG